MNFDKICFLLILINNTLVSRAFKIIIMCDERYEFRSSVFKTLIVRSSFFVNKNRLSVKNTENFL